jgi:outer membrane lipoprotein carrier protein
MSSLLLAAFVVLANPSAKAPAPDVKALVERVQTFYEKTQDFSADFTQRYEYRMTSRSQTSEGKVLFKKPAMMRWDYSAPSPRTFVLAADKAYAYDPAAQTLTKSAFSESQLSSAVTFLWGKGHLLDEFEIAKKPCSECKGVLLELDPKKPDGRFKKVDLEVDPKTAQVLASTVVDPNGDVNEIRFKNLKTNIGLTEDKFQLNVPREVQVLDMTKGH